MHIRLILSLILSFTIGVSLGHYKPEFFAIPISYIKNFLIDDEKNIYKESILRLEKDFLRGSCGSEEEGYSFFVAGHVYGTPGELYKGIYQPFKTNNILNSCLFMPLGFLLGDAVVEASEIEFEILKKEIDSFRKDTKIYISPGNHEVGSGKYNAKRDVYMNNFGDTYKYFKYRDDLFIVLDGNENNWNIADDQLEMLRNLASREENYNNVFIFSHQVIWNDPQKKEFLGLIPNSNEGKAEKLTFWSDVFPLIKDLGSKVYIFAGDVGAFDNRSEFFYNNFSGVSFFATGMGGGKRDNFLLIHVKKDRVNIDLIEL